MTTAAGDDATVVRPPSRMVLGLVPGLGNSFWNVIINAIEDVLIRAGYGVTFGDTRFDPVREAHYERMLRAGHVDGLILFNTRAGSAPRLIDIGLPTVAVYSDIPDLDRVPTFGVANRDAAVAMVEYLIGLGHRRIAHISGPDGNLDGEERLRGYGDALAAAGIAVDPALIWRGGYAFVGGARATQRYLALAVSDRPTAIFAASDEMAIGCISALRENGLAVPDEISVAGFDGIDYSAMYEPPLTTMLQPRSELGRLAAEELVRQLSGRPAKSGWVRLPCKLVVRQSVGPAGRDAGGRRPAGDPAPTRDETAASR